MTFYFNQFNITDEKFNEISIGAKYKQLQKFFNKINELRKVKSRTEDTKKKFFVKDGPFKVFNIQVGQQVGKYNKLLNAEKKMSLAVDTILLIYFLMIMIM